MKTKTPKVFNIRNYNNKIMQVVIGEKYSAIGTCGMTDGKEVIGTLENIDQWGAYIFCNGIPHLCNERTLKSVK
jgi:hypothetical protein